MQGMSDMPLGDLAPELAVLLGAVGVLLLAMLLPQRHHRLCAPITILVLASATALALSQAGAERFTFSGTFRLDAATTWGRVMVLGLTALCVAMTPAWMEDDRRHGEFYSMMLLSALGAMAMIGAADLMQMLMGALLSSVTGYVLAAYHRDWEISLEAGMKYFLLGALANALMVFGAILVMGLGGSTDYQQLSNAFPTEPLALVGLACVVFGLFFKLGAVPGHAWVPDVAEGAPLPAAAFLTVVPKIAGAIALARLVALVPAEAMPLSALVATVAALTMTWGNLSAMWQEDLRRLLGWSSVSQTGYALMAVAVLGRAPDAWAALIAFMGVYGLANIACFAVVAHLRGRTELAGWAGIGRQHPLAVSILALGFLSLVGIPPLAGFLGKFALFKVALDGGMAWLALLAVANTVLSLFYYLRVLGPAVMGTPEKSAATLGRANLWIGALAAVGVVLLLPWAWQDLWRALSGG
ncbi:NADH dehydrogenase subunit N [Brevirhabdus pacifica]|nr:NADH-quinone oxidoreductase subunit N [Brevirhabdus pacifica]PJJ86221.1 NADH dehydrogenase subunit N [Brevirhabdus pacifica]